MEGNEDNSAESLLHALKSMQLRANHARTHGMLKKTRNAKRSGVSERIPSAIKLPSAVNSAFKAIKNNALGIRAGTTPHTILEAWARAPAEGGLTQAQFNALRWTNPEQYARISQLLRDEAVTYLPNLALGARGTISNAEIDWRMTQNPKLASFIAERRVPAAGGKRRYSKTRSKKRR